MLIGLLHDLRVFLAGRGFDRSVARNRRAAEGLDAAVRELLRR
jgi:hypothetical protein